MRFDQAIVAVFEAPLMAPFPPGTRWLADEGRVLHWDPRRDVYQAALYTPFPDTGRWVTTMVELYAEELHRVERGEAAFQLLVYRKIKLMQMRHWFALAYARGGYC